MSHLHLAFTIAFSAATMVAWPAQAAEIITYGLTLSGKSFSPGEIKVPSGKPFIIKMTNANAAPAELEGKEMNIEKIAAGNSTIVVRVKALAPGKYLFVDEYQEDIARGHVIAE